MLEAALHRRTRPRPSRAPTRARRRAARSPRAPRTRATRRSGRLLQFTMKLSFVRRTPGSRSAAPVGSRPPRSVGQPVSAAASCSRRSSRARAIRDRIVPTGTPQTSAASAYEQPEHLGEDERLPAVGIEPGDERGERVRAGDVVGAFVAGDGAVEEAGGEAAPPRPGADGVGAGPAGDHEQPGAGAGLGPVAGQRAPRADERVLGDVVGGVRAHEVGGQAPDLALAPPDHRGQRDPVAVAAPRPAVPSARRCPHRIRELGCDGGRLPLHDPLHRHP